MNNKIRCDWAISKYPLILKYHDEEWGVPLHDDYNLFELLILEGFQAGLNWNTILKKRENFRIAFSNFRPEIIVHYDETKIRELISNSLIIRSEVKIKAAINNANAFLKVKEKYGTFDSYLWEFVENAPIINKWESIKSVPQKTAESDRLSKSLSSFGFKFVGPTICYAFMQATGMVNDHLIKCFRHDEVIK